MNTHHARRVARVLAAAGRRKAAADPLVRGADWRTATVATVGTDATVTTTDGVPCRRMGTYTRPQVGDQIVITRSGAGNWVAIGPLAGASDGAWSTPALATGYTGNGNNQGTPQYKVVNRYGDLAVVWRGGLSVTYSSGSPVNSGNFLAAMLPTAARPSGTRTMTVACSASTSTSLSVKVDFTSTGGTVVVVQTGVTPPWISLNNVVYFL